MPAGNVKGKTWGPSTVHQRERGHLPALRQTSARAPQFSKSAPNITNKSRIPASNASQPEQQQQQQQQLQQQYQPQMHHSNSGRMNILGKSIDGLSTISNGNCSSTNTSNHTNNLNNNQSNSKNRSHAYDADYFDEDDEDEAPVKTCFPFLRGGDDSYLKRKKYSLDSKMDEHKNEKRGNSVEHAATDEVSAGTSFASSQFTLRTVTLADGNDADDETNDENASFDTCQRNMDNVAYDRVFYRTIQKSLDEIFSREDYNQQFGSQNARNSKSSGDLTNYSCNYEDTDDSYSFHRYGSGSGSKFDRKCFFVHPNDSGGEDGNENGDRGDGNDSEAEQNRSVRSNVSVQDNDLSQNSTDSPLDVSFASINLNGNSFSDAGKQFTNRSFDERTNSMCSDQSDLSATTPSASRKSSVTFRVDGTDGYRSTTSIVQSNDSISYRSDSDVTAQFIPPPHYHHMKPIRASGGMVKTASSIKREKPVVAKSKSKFKGLKTQFLKITRGNALLHSNSFYNKLENKTDLNEQLLVDDHQSTAVSAPEPQYEAIFTRNFLLAKQKEN